VKVVGLTGGIASGKSTVARMFKERGAITASADEDARTVLVPPSLTLDAVFTAFPDVRETVSGEPDRVNRARLAAIIFADKEARIRLNSIMHPAIRVRMRQAIDTARANPQPGLLVYEVPLLFEGNLETWFDATITVLANPTLQAERLQERERIAGRPALTAHQLAERLQAQMPPEEKARRATYVIHTDTSLEETKRQVEAVWEALSDLLPTLSPVRRSHWL
jgi:dephospho-CoA kinase